MNCTLSTILITSNGACKLGAFGFTPTGHSSSDSANVQAFHYAYIISAIALLLSFHSAIPAADISGACAAGIGLKGFMLSVNAISASSSTKYASFGTCSRMKLCKAQEVRLILF
ncbi:uncharacterized protein [Coffea arabica]|uniref:Uncharacterized protein isoform X2 n=1 Tax=Coffea arabica TaxID=13443 RepID=A0A6P6V6Y1_COFAR|nr:uncharacterized protein LOC113717847 isoform X2 [Coffea arabica]